MSGETYRFCVRFLLAVSIPAILASSPAFAKIIYVDDDANTPGDGKSWATAYRYLQDALSDAKAADKPVEIRIGQGIYRPNQRSNQAAGNSRFDLISGVALMGGYAGIGAFGWDDPNMRDIPRYETILSGDLAGNDVEPNDPRDLGKEPTRADNTNVIQIYQADNVLLDAITITGGRLISPSDARGGLGGAGIMIGDSSPTINKCTFRGNWAQAHGGAIEILSGQPHLQYCVFVKNHAGVGGAIRGGQEGTTISNCSFADNSADRSGGAVIECAGMISDCTFERNDAIGGGGGALASCRGLITRCLFFHNTAGDYGGAVNNSGYQPMYTSCIFAENRAVLSGGGLFVSSTDVAVANCSFWANAAPDGSAITVYAWSPAHPVSNLRLTSSVLWDEGNEIWQNGNSIIAVSYSDVHGGYGGVGNIDADPLFADPNNEDFHLKSQCGRWDPSSQSWVIDSATSSCIDAGDPNAPIGDEPFPNGGRINMGAYGGTVEASKSHFGRTACNTIMAGDINGDCRVDWRDLAILGTHWLQTE